jgi:hypothetical protein
MHTWGQAFLGNWSGNNRLHLSWPQPASYDSAGSIEVMPAAKGKGLRIDYQWSHEGKPEQGSLLVAWHAEQQVATAAWIDSWHQDKKVMHCTGKLDAGGVLRLLGHFEAPPGPDWGWRISFTPGKDNLQMRMDVITPEGKEDLAVLADYRKT